MIKHPSMTRLGISIVAILLLFSAPGKAQENQKRGSDAFLRINPSLSYELMEPNQNLRKINLFMERHKEGLIKEKQLIVGVSLLAIANYQKSNLDSKFGYLMRHPTANNQIGKEVSEAVIHSFQISTYGSINNWLSIYAELLYNPEQSFGAGTITALGRNQVQLRKGSIIIGDLNAFPVYGAIGKMDAPFGQTGSVSPFTNSTMWHAFGGLGYGAMVGFKKWGLHTSLMLAQGGAQFRAMHTPVASTNVPSKLNNFVGDINYSLDLNDDLMFRLGGSYLHGSAYCQEFPVTHFAACSENNPAYTYYGTLVYKERLTVKGGFAKTVNLWPGTHNPTPPLDVFEASKVSSLDVGARYLINQNDKLQFAVSGEFSDFRSGPDGSPWERQNQIILGFDCVFNKSSKLFVELFHTDGYSPLNFISGSDPFNPFPPGVTHSVNNAASNGIVVGGLITF